MTAPRLRLDQLSPALRAQLGDQIPTPSKATRRAAKASRGPSPLEERFALGTRAHGLPAPEREHRFDSDRQWRFDFAWPALRLAVEIEGGVWSGGRHTRGSGFVADCDKYNAATLAGWRVLRFTERHVKNGSALRILREALAFRDPPSVP